jgi:hypothetical protein
MQNSKLNLKINILINQVLRLKFLTTNLRRGQALITLIFFIIVGVTITSTAIIIILINSQAASKLEQGTMALSIAESGAENAILRLLRNPAYSGETLSVGDGTAVIYVNSEEPKIITSEGKLGNSIRKIRVQIGYNNNILTIQSWKEIY